MFPRSLTYHDNKSFFLFGPRGVGKTGWLRRTFPNELYFDLLEARTYSQLLADPTRLAERIPHDYSGWVILVEVQRIPELLNEVHRLMEHLLVSNALPVFRPHTTSTPLARMFHEARCARLEKWLQIPTLP